MTLKLNNVHLVITHYFKVERFNCSLILRAQVEEEKSLTLLEYLGVLNQNISIFFPKQYFSLSGNRISF